MIPSLQRTWTTIPLKSVCQLIMGQAPTGDSYNENHQGVPLLAGAGDLGRTYPAPKKWTQSPTKVGLAGDIVICVRATIGDLNWADTKYCYGRGVAGVRVLGNFDPWFVWYWLTACKGHLLSLGRGATFKQISKTDLAELPVPNIGTSEQRRIVARIKECMDRVNEIASLRSESLKERAYLIESLTEAQFKSVVGVEVRMSDAAAISSTLVDPTEAQFQSLLHVGGANIESKTGRLLDLKTAAEEDLRSGKFTFDPSMVLYNKIRPYLMKTARPEFSGLCSADMYPLSPKSGRITRDFLYYVLMSRRFTDYAISGSNRAGMPKVNREHLFAYSFTLPSLDVQERITAQLDDAVQAVLDLEGEMTTAQTETTVLREAILRKAFAGEL